MSQQAHRPEAYRREALGIAFAFICLAIVGVMPIISDSRPAGSDALSFALLMSFWQLVCSLPLVWRKGQAADVILGRVRTTVPRGWMHVVTLGTGMMFGLSTYVFVLSVDKAGEVSTAIALQAYPLFSTLWEVLFLGKRKSWLELVFTLLMILALVYLATNGTFRIAGLSLWFLVALATPLLWSVAHVALKEVLDRSAITPAQVTFSRLLVSTCFLFVLWLSSGGGQAGLRDVLSPRFQELALLLGAIYYLELLTWFHAVRHVDVSVASSITIPAPALTMLIGAAFMHVPVRSYQVAAMGVIVVGMYGLLYAGKRKRVAAGRIPAVS
ncbi:DMT family transporter [Gluconacetobacter azotocaptans]|uniref:DMT family transporter n=1 Tax=Gluconacetobacter azotocaptans TaxID=142834 RepID=UPI00195D33E8|nr:DMT family transporter [Gluconacetobacter azotocaptans]MBM9400451.1 DMT family transporter [Gluconacetobacter azotocaptans]